MSQYSEKEAAANVALDGGTRRDYSANDQYIKPIAEKLREFPKSQFHMTKRQAFERLIELTAELAEKLEPAEVRGKEKP